MSERQIPLDDQPEHSFYEIRIKGRLDDRRAAWFEGLTITLADNGDTLLSGLIVDQAALHGWLKKIRDSGMHLLSINHIQSGVSNTKL